MTLGRKRSGKSALLETIAVNGNGPIFDLYGSRDNEGLTWLRSPLKDKKILLLHGDNMKVDTNIADTCKVSEFTLAKLDEYTVIISAGCCYNRIEDEWKSVCKVADQLWHRESWSSSSIVKLMIREGSNLLASRDVLGHEQTVAIIKLAYCARELAHSGFQILIDSIRDVGIDKSIRTSSDYIFIKALGVEGLPDEISFLYRYFHPRKVQRMPPDEFRVMSAAGPLGLGTFDLPYWHVHRGENLKGKFDITIKSPEGIIEEDMDLFHTTDNEHARIIELRVTPAEDGKKRSMAKIAAIVIRSSKVVLDQIRLHNENVSSNGVCPRCQSVQGRFQKIVI